MSSLDKISAIKSFRKCRDETIPRKEMGRILEAGRNTPSPGGVNSLEFVVVEDDESLESIEEIVGDRRISESSAVVVIVGDIDRMDRKVGGNGFDYCFAEASVSAQNMRIESVSYDLASIWVSGFDYEVLKEKLDVPEGKLPLALVGFGYTDNPVDMENRWGMNEICYYEYYGNQVGSNFDSLDWKGVREEKRIYGKKLRGMKDKIVRRLRKVL